MQLKVVQHFVSVYVYGHNSVTGTFLKYCVRQNNASQPTKSPFRVVNMYFVTPNSTSIPKTELKSLCKFEISTG